MIKLASGKSAEGGTNDSQVYRLSCKTVLVISASATIIMNTETIRRRFLFITHANGKRPVETMVKHNHMLGEGRVTQQHVIFIKN